ncbi:hypothetical protein BDQ12DRAFT_688856 [Crucibulum laeve]|uniref:Uncharacterized protein n=1 Tax=Crucibulum laeve TaxID=68775 RepID=A0A5C3LRM8_9AGAR|nr:hypothetical protein BDQ12DRAFT_688856 [Crucibulum laeve]
MSGKELLLSLRHLFHHPLLMFFRLLLPYRSSSVSSDPSSRLPTSPLYKTRYIQPGGEPSERRDLQRVGERL